MASQQEIMNRAFRVANMVGTDANASPLIDNSVLTEDMFREALRRAVIQDNFKRDYVLQVSNGTAELPDGVILDRLKTATIDIPDDDTPTSYEMRFYDYKSAPHVQLNYATSVGKTFHFRDAGGDANDFDGDVNLNVVALPDLPDDVTDEIEMPDTLADTTVEVLARLMRGE